MAKTETIHMRVNAELKRDVEELLEQLGMSTTEAINIFLNQIILNGGLPFMVKVPKYNEKTEQAIKEARGSNSENSKVFKSRKDFFEELEN